jgi:hypothetical protein
MLLHGLLSCRLRKLERDRPIRSVMILSWYKKTKAPRLNGAFYFEFIFSNYAVACEIFSAAFERASPEDFFSAPKSTTTGTAINSVL